MEMLTWATCKPCSILTFILHVCVCFFFLVQAVVHCHGSGENPVRNQSPANRRWSERLAKQQHHQNTQKRQIQLIRHQPEQVELDWSQMLVCKARPTRSEHWGVEKQSYVDWCTWRSSAGVTQSTDWEQGVWAFYSIFFLYFWKSG